MKETSGKRVRQGISALLSTTMLLSALSVFPAIPAAAAGSCTVDTSVTYQTIRGFGGMNHPEWQSVNTQYGAGGDMTAEQVQTAFGNGANELGLTILRIFVSDDSNAWKNAVPTAKRAQALGATVFATPWNPPASMRSKGGGTDQTGLYVLNNGAEPQYAQHLNSYVKYMEGQGINLYSISVQNEPDYSREWTFWSPERATNFIANYASTVKAGTNVKLMSPESFQYGPESWGYGKNYYKQIINNPKAFANCDLFGTHFYGTSCDSMNYPTVENCGKEIWMTEVYVPNSDANSADKWDQALQAAENIHNGLVVGNMSAYVWWYIRRQYSLMWDDGRVSKRGACMAQYSKWVRPGAVRIAATEQPESNILCSAYQNVDGTVAIVAINKGSNGTTENFTLSGGEKISDVSAWHSTSTENFRACSAPSFNDGGFTAQLPAQSVTTFLVSTGEPEPDPDGYFFHDTFESSEGTWTGRGAATVAASGAAAYESSKSLAVTGRTAVWNGATRPLSSKTFKPGDSFSFSADVNYTEGGATETFHLTLEYTDSEGTAHYDKVASATVVKGQWTQLANPSFKIPAGASDLKLYVETEDTTLSFYVDEVIGAPDGMQIAGPAPITFKLGDVDGDGRINGKDLTLAKRVAMGTLKDAAAKLAADVNQDGDVTVADIVWYVKYLTGETEEFPEAQSQQEEVYTGSMRTITEYTNAVKDTLVEYEPNSSTQKKNGVTYPQVKKEYYFSKKANKQKPYNIMLPANYDPSKKYPVLYLLHGFFEDEDRMILTGNAPPIPTPQIITNAIAEGAAKEMIVVVPLVFTHPTKESATSFSDYESSVGYDNFVDDIVDSLMPHIEGNYSVATGKANTAVTGFSMGGRESLRIGMKYADKFGYIGAICPAPGVEGPWSWGSEEAAPSLVLLTGGTNDDVVGLSTPQGYHNNFDKAGTPHIWHVVNGGYHGDNCIRAHIYNFVRMIFKA
ncbi:MAG: carbohydrate binding domain-containing protein [Oscillospiraceae bacterium]|nr:carbohydrate binding domain-containing protein [Oscillospiraceae bacterium]